MKTTKKSTSENLTGYKFNKSLILKKAHLLFNESIELDSNNRTSLNFALCLKQAWNEAKTTKQRILSRVNNPTLGNEIKPIENTKPIETIKIENSVIRPVIIETVNNTTLDFNTVYKQYNKEILRYLAFKCYNSIEVSKNVHSIVFEKIFLNLKTFDENKASLKTWVYRIANNTLIDYFRTTKDKYFVNVGQFTDNETGKELFNFIDEVDLDTENDKTELNNNLKNAISELKPQYKQALDLYYNQDKSYNEIAEILNIKLGNVKATISRAKDKLEVEKSKIYHNVIA